MGLDERRERPGSIHGSTRDAGSGTREKARAGLVVVVTAASMALTHKPVNVLYPGVARGLCGCGHVMLAKSDAGIKAALGEHVLYVIATGDPNVCNVKPIKLWRS